ncbi:MAG: hypothetical protein AAGC88_04115 [Bacteroidota bacterium]
MDSFKLIWLKIKVIIYLSSAFLSVMVGCSEDNLITSAHFTPIEILELTITTVRLKTTVTYQANVVGNIGYHLDSIPELEPFGRTFIEPLPEKMDVGIVGLVPLTQYYITPYAVLDGRVFEGQTATFTTTSP